MHILFIKGRRFKFDEIAHVAYADIVAGTVNDDLSENNSVVSVSSGISYRSSGNPIVRVDLSSGKEIVLNDQQALDFLMAYDEAADEVNNG